MTSNARPIALRTVLGNYPHTLALKRGEIASAAVTLDFVEVKPTNLAFKPMVREQQFDVCEIAIVTFLQAKAYGKPLALIPAVMLGRFQHHCMLYNRQRGTVTPQNLAGKRVGVRAYTVTTGVWARGILASEYGVDLDKVTWVIFDEEHVQEYHKDYPANVVYQAGANLGAMVANGELAAAIGVGRVDSPDVKPLIPNAREAEAAWYQKTGLYPINHTVVVKDSLLQADPTLAPRLFTAFKEAKAAFLQQLHAGAALSGEAQTLAQLDRRADPGRGYAPLMEPMLRPVLRRCVEHGIPIVSNIGAAQ